MVSSFRSQNTQYTKNLFWNTSNDQIYTKIKYTIIACANEILWCEYNKHAQEFDAVNDIGKSSGWNEKHTVFMDGKTQS